MTATKKDIKKFYDAIGAAGLAGLLSPERHVAYLDYLKSVLPAGGTILDCACGYGRLTLPLAQLGYKMFGIDQSAAFIEKARAASAANALQIPFTVGDMCQLPYDDAMFDAVICMWSSFNELLAVPDQIKALKEMRRVTKPGGFVVIDMPCLPDNQPVADEERISEAELGGYKHVAYIHDEKSLNELMRLCGIARFSISNREMGAIKRLVLFLHDVL